MKKSTLKLAALAIALTAISFSAEAQEGEKRKGPDLDKMFTKYDTDKSGDISLDEFKSVKRKREVGAERLEKMYAVLDGDSNGAVTLEELKANFSKTRGKRGEGKGKKKD